ncbi:MAG: hypothetical protein CVV03_09530 [Firmicutes bacterium HGW-Firmicutes-8]|nr:MAG: hypothetical protein CVV03_09530 [Firmicutes bacterium HGW-Firmicutes-8]
MRQISSINDKEKPRKEANFFGVKSFADVFSFYNPTGAKPTTEVKENEPLRSLSFCVGVIVS